MGVGVNSSKQSDEPRKRLSKLRSVKVTNLDRLRLSMKRTKSRLSQGIVIPDDSVEMDFKQKQSPTSKFQQSPNYMKATSCFNARSGSSHLNPGDNSIARKSVKGVKRMYSLKRLRKLPSMKSDTFHGNGEVTSREDGFEGTIKVGPAKLNLIRSGSIKITRVRSIKMSRRRWSKSRLDQASTFMTDDETAEELSSESDLQKNVNTSLNAPNLKHVRTLYKMPSLRSKRRLAKKHFDRATCSSTLKSSNIPQADHVSGVCESEYQLIGHVCPYTYCSFHGHLHSPSPSLESFISTKRRLLKKQRSIWLKRKPNTEATFYRDVSRMNQSRQQQVSLQEHADSPDTEDGSEEFLVEIYDNFTEPRKADAESIESDELHKQSTAPDSTEILSDNRKYTNMWKLIYKHLSVPGTEAIKKDGNADTEGFGCNLNQEHRDENQDMNLENQFADSEKVEFNQAEAIQFVQQAVDEILHLDEQSPLNPADPAKEVKDIQEVSKGAAVAEKVEDPNEGKRQPIRQRSKGFEKLRKMMIAAKFVNAVEKLRRINPRKPRFLSPEEMSKIERVQLRHLSMDGRRHSEEWMLDFALQQVISKLAPAQQRRVEMLVKAFERVTPEINIACDPEKMPTTNYSAPTDIVLEEERSIELDLDNIVQDPERKVELDSCVATTNGEDHILSGMIASEAKDEAFENSTSNKAEEGSYHGVLKEVRENSKQDRHLTENNGKQELNREDQEKGSDNKPSNLSPCEEPNFVFDKEKFTHVWHMVYKQFIAQEATVSGEKKVDGKEQHENVNASSNINQADAVQLVQEAIDELLCLHEQLSDQQPSKSCKVPEQNNQCSPMSIDSAKEKNRNRDAIGEGEEEEEERRGIDDQKALQRQSSKPLSKLRKMVLSAKFIKTMEKLRKIRTCKIENLSSEVSPGAEKVSLRHLSVDERRNGEEWMLDSALQQVISKLAPAQQKRVALLTQAFETFTPELQHMSARYSRIKMQPEDYIATNKQKDEEEKFVVMDHDTPIIHDGSVLKSDDLIHNQTNTKGCPPSCSDNVQTKDSDFKTMYHSEQEQTVFDSHEDEDKVKASRFVLEEGKYSKMWKMIYQHVKSNSSADSENQTTEIRTKEDQTDEKLEITQSDAIKLVQEAVDGILQQQEKSEEGNKSEQNSFKGYSKWKRAVICTKFVKAMEKMQKLYTQKRRSHYNMLIPDPEVESVHLRQCLMDERSNSEVWMLDYALRQVIAKLAPVQQQKVALLIEAFETVGPNTQETTTKEIQHKMSDPSNMVLTSDNEEIDGDDDIVSQGESSQSQDIRKDTNDGGNNVFLEGKKYSSMWCLIHQHIKSGITNADAEQIPAETDVCDSDLSSTDSEVADQNIDSENAQLQQKDAIKLVEEAVNEILEMQVQSTDSEEKTMEEDKARQELPSVLSKVILCKKFIKAMEKMKKSKPRVRHHLPRQSELPAENVHLRAQRMDDKNCEEWMLDYALQQVIGKLAPTQKKKVSLLVEAFERVNPPPDSIRHQRFNGVA